jgi:hypothetical protein
MIENTFKEIRDLCNHPWKREVLFQDKVKWNKLWASMDVLEDSQIAIEDYSSLKEFDSDKKGYLYVYGILQALNLQQDSLRNLNVSLFGEDINFKEKYPELYKIRENRNNSIGHPTDRMNGKSFHHISRDSIKKEGFTMLSYFPKTGEESKFEDINILSCIETQEKLLTKILNKTMEKLESDFDNHKNKFKEDKLLALIHPSISYQFSKLYENIHRDYDLVEINYNAILETYDKIKKGIILRYQNLSALDGILLNTEMLDYLFIRVKRDLIDFKIKDQFELRIFVTALELNFEELKSMLKEIDEEFQ